MEQIEEKDHSPTFLQRKTGADLNAWIRRAREFIHEPERRQEMIYKLTKFFERHLIKSSNEYDKLSPLVLVDDDKSGLKTYYFGNEYCYKVGISLVPNDALLFDDTRPVKEHGLQRAKLWRQEEPNKHHFIFTPTIADISSVPGNEIPYLGKASMGGIIKPFTTNLVSLTGGLVLGGNKLEIVTDRIWEKHISVENAVEEVLFVATDTNWDEVANNDAVSGLSNDWTGIGYFTKGDLKRYFVIQSNNQFNMTGVKNGFEALNKVMNNEHYDSWKIAGLDIGGGYAGLVREDVDNTLCFRGAGATNPDTISENKLDLWSNGHSRNRFFVFSWEKEIEE